MQRAKGKAVGRGYPQLLLAGGSEKGFGDVLRSISGSMAS